MFKALALAAPLLQPRLDWLRSAIVCSCALALILADQALPNLSL